MIYLIGESPPPGATLPHTAFTGKSGQRLSEIVGFKVHEVFATRNLLNYIPPESPSGRGMSFPLLDARERAKVLLNSIEPEDHVIIVGRRCLKAFRPRKDWRPMIWRSVALGTYLSLKHTRQEDIKLTWIPHPSSTATGRWYNDHENRRKVKKFLEMMRDVGQV